MARLRFRSKAAPKDAPAGHGLGEDIIAAEILPRLPVKSLLRFKSVCRSWRALISDPSFVSTHLNLNLNRSESGRKLALVPFGGDDINIYRLSPGLNHAAHLFGITGFDPTADPSFTRIQHANGLLLMSTRWELILLNPSTREHAFLHLGSPCKRGRISHPSCLCVPGSVGMGFVPGSNAPKLARHFRRESGSVGFEVLTLGTTDPCWRAAADPPYPIDPHCSPASVRGGMVYFKIHDRRLRNELLLSFDLKSDRFAAIPTPSTVYRGYRLQELDGELCLVDGEREVWMYEGGAWSHAFTISPPDWTTWLYIVGARREGRLLVCAGDHSGRAWLSRYDPASQSLTHAADLEETRFLSYNAGLPVVSYVESLVPVPAKCRAPCAVPPVVRRRRRRFDSVWSLFKCC